MNDRNTLRVWRSIAAVLLCAAWAGCETQTTRVRTADLPNGNAENDLASPTRALVEAPADLHDLSGFLLRYRVEYGVYPPTLTALRDVGIMPAEGYEGLPDYAYHPDGLGTLPASGDARIVVVDHAMRIADHAWCVLQMDRDVSRTAALDVRLVPVYQLRAATERR